MDATIQQPPDALRADGEIRTFISRAVLFVLVGLALYAGVYAASERLIYKHGRYNRFLMVKTSPRVDYDHLILGASHAAVFDYRDLNARLEDMTGSHILNLSIVGAGVTVNRLMLEYFLVGHRARTVVYVLDSFAFYSPEWNEERLADARLFQRAPFDTALARLLFRSPARISVALDYVSGFSKINNPARFEADVRPEEGSRFDRTYRPVVQIDEERIAYLYPNELNAAAILQRDRYLSELEALIHSARARGLKVLVVRPPIPARVFRVIPGEALFDVSLRTILDRAGAELHDFSQAANDEQFFYDTDHLNRNGVLHFFENHLSQVLGQTS